MGAICGRLDWNRGAEPPRDLKLMLKALRPHGPDQSEQWEQPLAALGCCIRSATGRRCGAQIAISRDSRVAVVSETRLIGADGAPRDSERILLAYSRWGEECVHHLQGSYTFALVDTRDQLLLLARSPTAETNIFYFAQGATVAFASAPKGLFALPFIPRQLNPQSIADYLVSAPDEPGSSFFRNVHRLPCGYALSFSPGAKSLRRFWRLESSKQLRYGNDGDYVDQFNSIFTEVVAHDVGCDGRVGLLLSGGLDSTAIAAVAAPLLARLNRGLPAFTEIPDAAADNAVPDGRYASEEPYVRAMADRYPNIDLHLLPTPPGFFLDGIDDFFKAAEAPFRNAANRIWFENIFRHASGMGIAALLTGASGNLTISWTGSNLLAELARAGRLGRAWKEARALAPRTTAATLLGRTALPLVPDAMWSRLQKARFPQEPLFRTKHPWQIYSPLNAEFARETRLEERARDRGHSFYNRPHRNTLEQRLSGLRTRDLGTDLARGLEMLYGIESRDPAGDVRLLEFCMAVPEDQYRRDGEPRWLLRRAMRGRVPDQILDNTRRGYQASDWAIHLHRSAPLVVRTVEEFAARPLVRHILDVPRLAGLARAVVTSAPAELARDPRQFRQVLGSGLMTGRFLQWFESGER